MNDCKRMNGRNTAMPYTLQTKLTRFQEFYE